MSTAALQLVPKPERPTATRRTNIREAVETWRRTEARHVPIESIEKLIDALTRADADSRVATKSEVDRIDDAIADLHGACRMLDAAEGTLTALRRVITGQH